MISVRDAAAIRYMAKRDFSTKGELEQFYCSEAHAKLNLYKLMKKGIVEKIRVRDIFYFELRENIPVSAGNMHQNSCLYKLTKKVDPRFGISMDEVRHSVFVSHVFHYLEKEYPGAVLRNDRTLEQEDKLKVIPDIEVKGAGFRLAIEIERTKKSRDRYIRKFLDYDRSLYTHVIFYTVGNSIGKMIRKLCRSYRFISVGNLAILDSVWSEHGGIQTVQEFVSSHWLK